VDLRVDPLSGRLVAVAPGRARRPGGEGGFELDPETPEEREACPFCEGREDQTPPETFAIPGGREPDTPGWKVRVVPNKYPAFERQEVVVHAPEHVRSLAQLGAAQLELVAQAWQARAAAARAEGFPHLFACVNEGKLAGSSLPHSHSQLVWLREEPPLQTAEHSGDCRVCALLERERAEGTRVITEESGLVLLCPYAGRAPYECLIAPVEHRGNGFDSNRLGGALALAARALKRLGDLRGPAPANLWLHNGDHWHVELLPRLNIFAGVELGTGHYVNSLAPEQAAEDLRG
jgi:UDPglucose--hexose-1-phosphate uridylyltransferase